MNASPYSISSERLWSDLMELGEIGSTGDGGVSRPGLSPGEEEARQWFIAACKKAGLTVRMDAMRNVIAQLPSKNPGAKILATGSHLDSVPNGGRFDGALGAVAALECARVIIENKIELPFTLEVGAFVDEEGAYGAGSVGSRAMLGTLSPGELQRVSTRTGTSFADDLAKLGGDASVDVRRSPEEFAYYVELHLEQGPRLENAGKDCGPVTAIVGIERYEVVVTGEAGHAGTTPMQGRKDALVMAAPFFTLLPQWAMEQNPEMVATIGTLQLHPGGANIIPGECRFVVGARSAKQEDLDAIGRRIMDYVKDKPAFSVKQIYKKPGAVMHPEVIAAIEKGAAMAGCSSMPLSSGAGHDAQTLGPYLPTGMIFVPCRKGLSHNPGEWIEPEQAAKGAQVLLNSLLILSGKA